MDSGLLRAIHFARAWARPETRLGEDEVEVETTHGTLDATRYRRRGAPPGPAWILLHGMTRTGRRHTTLMRFARSIAESGATVLVPEVPEWVELTLAPDRTLDAVKAGLAFLEGDPEVTGKPGLMGFSFGGPQALRVSAEPEVRDRLACVASFGGYGDLESTLRFLLTGIHHLDGVEHRVSPDPYGRWIVAANYLTRIPGFEAAGPVADAFRALAAYAGDHTIDSWDRRLDPLKESMANEVAEEWMDLFRLFAPRAERDPLAASHETDLWARRLADAAQEADPELALPERLVIPFPTYLLHGRNDHLIPFSELGRLARRVQAPRLEVTVTRLFAHSAGDPRPHGPVAWTRELWMLGRTLSHLFGEV